MKKLVFVLLVQAIFISVFAQNHSHFTPSRSQSARIVRMDSSIYRESTTVEVKGLSSTTHVEAEKLYTIPKHLRDLDTDVIDSIVRENKSFTTIKLSWFIIWDRTYTKDVVYHYISWNAITSLLIAHGVILLFFVILVCIVKKSIKEGIKALLTVDCLKALADKDTRDAIFIYVVCINIIAFVLVGIQNPTIEMDVLLGFFIYDAVILLVFYLLLIIRKKLFKKNFLSQKN